MNKKKNISIDFFHSFARVSNFSLIQFKRDSQFPRFSQYTAYNNSSKFPNQSYTNRSPNSTNPPNSKPPSFPPYTFLEKKKSAIAIITSIFPKPEPPVITGKRPRKTHRDDHRRADLRHTYIDRNSSLREGRLLAACVYI